MADIGSLVADLMVNDTQFNRSLDKAARNTKSFSSKTNRYLAKAEQGWKKISKTVFSYRSALVAAASATALGYFIKRNLDAADAIGKTADKIGITTGKLQEYRFMADRAGVDTAQLDKGLEQFVKRIGELNAKTGSMYEYLHKVDEELINQLLATKTTNEALDIYINKLTNAASASEKAALAAAGFGRSGVSLVNIVRGGSEEVEKLRQTFKDLGLEIDEDLIRNSEVAKDRLTDLTTVIKTRLTSAATMLAPAIAKVAEKITTWITENDKLIKQKMPEIVDNIASGLNRVADALGRINRAYKKVKEFWDRLEAGRKERWKKGMLEAAEELAAERGMAGYGKITLPMPTEKWVMPIIKPPAPVTAVPLPSPHIVDVKEAQMAAYRAVEKLKWEVWDAADKMKVPVKTVYEEFTILHQKVSEVWSDLWEKTKNYWGKAKTVISDIWGAIEKYGIGPIRMMITMPMQMATAMKDFVSAIQDFPKLVDEFIEGFNYLIDNLPEIVTKFVEGLEKLIPAFIKRLPEIIQVLADAIPDIAAALITGILEGLPDIIVALVNAVPTIVAEFVKHIPEIVAEFAKAIAKMVIPGMGEATVTGFDIVPDIVPIIGKWFHKGGIVGKTRTPKSLVSPNALAGAKRYHTGLRSNEHVGIFEEGEEIISRNRARRTGTPINITLHNAGVITTENVEEWLSNTITRLRKNKFGEEFSMLNIATAGVDI